MNITVENFVVSDPLHNNIVSPTAESSDYMIFWRVIFYIYLIFQIMIISFANRRKMPLRQRVLKKFIFSFQEIIRTFNEEDKKNMEIIIENTVKNAVSPKEPVNTKVKRGSKAVKIFQEKNNYYEPRKDQQIFYDLDRPKQERKNQAISFNDKKIDDQFKERNNLLEIDEETSELLPKDSLILVDDSQQPSRQAELQKIYKNQQQNNSSSLS